jgi:hypothetical protein
LDDQAITSTANSLLQAHSCLEIRPSFRLLPRWTRLSFDALTAVKQNVVETFNKRGLAMSTVNFSVPEDIKNAFNITFEGQNKSAVVAELMRDAVAREQRRKQHRSAVDRILADRVDAPRITEAEFRVAREEGRP